MNAMVLVLLGVFFIIISCLLTHFTSKTSKSKILKYIPVLTSLLGVLYFGIGPQIFNYVHGVTIGITFMILGIFCGIAFVTSLITLIYQYNKEKQK
ncbi:hypothetical protein [Clostridium sp. ZS2-4]|uniref:hypothetical protein n=1 Tax=Clostridium sp. ZS2-4 TaxID=2987703 RepID=UPI00227AD58D|nr:hypothetical protein [Clostridium sp. ZS2-4]MCY6354133.1 hypothetical protein [Clostridium sp. ZS2-4]